MRTKVSKYVVQLNEEQQAAVNAPINKPVVVLAGPGSGKTAVIAARYAHLVDIEGIKPSNIVAVTFTGDMAKSLLDRIKGASWDAYESEGISTIHAFALRQLKALGIITNQQKAKDWTIRKVIDDHIRLTGWDKSPGAVRWWIDRSKIEGIAQNEDDLWEYFDKSLKKLNGTERDADRLAACAMRVQSMLIDSRTWTFPDLVNHLWHATDDVHRMIELRSRIKYILVDEGQDTFELAVKLLRRICPDAFFIVGDQDQMLFRFTGASPETNLFQVAQAGHLFKLQKNYRSAKTIVRSANNLIEHNYTTETMKYAKKMEAMVGNDHVVFKHHEFEGPVEEARFVVDSIRNRGFDPGAVFVGARTNAQLAYIETELAGEGIPYIVRGTNGFFSQAHVKRVVDVLKKIEDPAYESGEADRGWQWRRLKIEVRDPLALTTRIVEDYLTYHRQKFGLVNADAGQDDSVVDDLRTLVDISRKFKTVHVFLVFIRETEKSELIRDESKAVVLSTIHKLKGAERDVVFGIGWSEGLLPHNKALSSRPDGDLPIGTTGSVNDERCAAFVLVTRAKHEVYLSSIRNYRDVELETSRFVQEILGY